MSSPTALPSPPHKRVKADHDLPSAGSLTEINEAPVNAMLPPSTSAAGPSRAQQKKSKLANGRKRKPRRDLPDPYSAGEVLWHDVQDFLGRAYVEEVLAKKDGGEWAAPESLPTYESVELRVGAFTVSGESLSLYEPEGSERKKWAVVAPFAHPGDLIRAKIIKHDRLHSKADLLEILEYSEAYRGGEGDRRKDPEAGCRYFGECGGCQLQPIPYPLQLAHKKHTVELAYQRFSALPSNLVPGIGETIGSPKQWGYRTKLTPHFDAMPKRMQGEFRRRAEAEAVAKKVGGRTEIVEVVEEKVKEDEEEGMNVDAEEVPGNCATQLKPGTLLDADGKPWDVRIGFERKGRPGVMDIEECPIATPVLNAKFTPERARIQNTIHTFTRGATLLLRDSLPLPSPLPSSTSPFDTSSLILPAEQHVAITNHKEMVYERVGPWLFEFSAGSFFQNNNSILEPLVEYVREAIFPAVTSATVPTYLVDTYCGSGLFGITLSPFFTRIAGVEISEQSITAAKRNAEINGLSEDKAQWIVGKAEEIFGGLPARGFKGDASCVVVDPPRKGCDAPFLTQLLDFQPATVVYVSCNVHTQARDVGWFLTEAEKRGDVKYVLESVRGFDLFPQWIPVWVEDRTARGLREIPTGQLQEQKLIVQTAHVESVAVLRRIS